MAGWWAALRFVWFLLSLWPTSVYSILKRISLFLSFRRVATVVHMAGWWAALRFVWYLLSLWPTSVYSILKRIGAFAWRSLIRWLQLNWVISSKVIFRKEDGVAVSLHRMEHSLSSTVTLVMVICCNSGWPKTALTIDSGWPPASAHPIREYASLRLVEYSCKRFGVFTVT